MDNLFKGALAIAMLVMVGECVSCKPKKARRNARKLFKSGKKKKKRARTTFKSGKQSRGKQRKKGKRSKARFMKKRR